MNIARLVRHIVWTTALAAAFVAGGCNSGAGTTNDNGDDIDDVVAFDVVLGDGFILRVRTGDTQGQDLVDICDAFFPSLPNHRLTVTSGVGMRIEAASEVDDVRLFVRCGQSLFCGEEVSPNVWQVSRFWATAVCDVFVGTPTEGGEANYSLEFLPN